MRFGLHLGNYGLGHTADRIIELATLADSNGYASVWVSDHVVAPVAISTGVPAGARGRQFNTDIAEECQEAIVLLSALSSMTRSVRLGTSVLVPAQRQPVVLAKQISTLDALSGGRVDIGVGAGWLAEEYAALGVPFEGRWQRLEETLDVFRALWTRRETAHEGELFRFEPVRMAPKPVSVGGPRITVGGRSARALRVAGERGEGLNAARLTPSEVATALGRVRGHAEAVGRDPEPMTVVLRCDLSLDADEQPDAARPWRLAGPAHVVAETLDHYRRQGTSEVIITVDPGDSSQQDDRIRWLTGVVAPLLAA